MVGRNPIPHLRERMPDVSLIELDEVFGGVIHGGKEWWSGGVLEWWSIAETVLEFPLVNVRAAARFSPGQYFRWY